MFLSPRQIHLDFHTSELIPDVAQQFDAAQFAQTFKAAHVSSVTVFARCHHGWLYYDSKQFPQRVHPALVQRNLLVEQVCALHAVGIRAPIYITVQWDYQAANEHPEWLIRKYGGAHEGGPFSEPGFYQSLCVNTAYADYVEAQTREVCQLLGNDLDGVFFDIVGIRPCVCATCRKAMAEEGIDWTDEAAALSFAHRVNDRFKARMTQVVHEYNPSATVFYNGGHVGPCTRSSADSYTHFELESLPSGSWGYLHFPLTARYARKLGKDCLGMTGKFHTTWADFHSLKNLAALEFEAFRMLSFGFACSIGDQLEPYGRLNPATYRLIGKVYEQFEQREAWARPSVPLTQVALITSESDAHEHLIPETMFGAAQLLEELAIQFDVLDTSMALENYELVILPDDLLIDGEYSRRLDAYVAAGGKVIACHHGGLDSQGRYPACFGAAYEGENPLFPDFLIAEGEIAQGLEPENEYVVYMQGAKIRPQSAVPVMNARAPYFVREGTHFSSHRYTPSAHGTPYPAVVRHGNVVLFSHPLFAQYRENAPAWIKTIFSNALDLLMPNRIVRHNGPSTLSVQVLGQPEQKRTCLHILSYIPVRKSATIDIIEERTAVHDVQIEVHIPGGFSRARLVPENVPLEVRGQKICVPVVNGYAIVELT